MDYMKSNSYLIVDNGNWMYDDCKFVLIVVEDMDMNMVIWSLMQVIKVVVLEGKLFDLVLEEIYGVFLNVLKQLFLFCEDMIGVVCYYVVVLVQWVELVIYVFVFGLMEWFVDWNYY